MIYPPREYDTPWGGRIRVNPDGTVTVIRRDFGLTTEPECSEEAHAQIQWWFAAMLGAV